MSAYLAYIDESGDPNFSDGSSKSFLVCAIVMPRREQHSVSSAIAAIKAKYGLTELKSSRITSVRRRIEICRALVSPNLKILTIRIDKSSLHGDWFRQRKTLYKYVQRLLNHEIYGLYGSVIVSFDRYGSDRYQQSFEKYLQARLQKQLFEPELLIGSARDSEFIQASDFLAGSIRKALENDFEDPDEILEIVKPAWVRCLELPEQGRHVADVPGAVGSATFTACMEEARRYLDAHDRQNTDPKIRTLEYLYYLAIDGSNDYIYTHEILEWLSSIGHHVSEEQFRNEVTAVLRDEGLIIASTRRGIKIPKSPDDIREYVSFNVNLILPVLRRLKRAITFVQTKTELKNIQEILSDEMQSILKDVGG